MDDYNLLEMYGMNTYQTTKKSMEQERKNLQQGFSQSLLDIDVMSTMNAYNTMQTASKYGIAPEQMLGMQLQQQQQQQSALGQATSMYGLGMQDIDLRRENLEFGRQQYFSALTDQLEMAAIEGTLTEESLSRIEEMNRLIYGEDMIDLSMFYSAVQQPNSDLNTNKSNSSSGGLTWWTVPLFPGM